MKPFNFGLRHENRKENFNQQQITIGDPFFALSPIATLKVNPYRLQLADAFPQTRAKHSEKKAKRKHWVKKQAKRASKYIGSKKSDQESNEMLACWMRN